MRTLEGKGDLWLAVVDAEASGGFVRDLFEPFPVGSSEDLTTQTTGFCRSRHWLHGALCFAYRPSSHGGSTVSSGPRGVLVAASADGIRCSLGILQPMVAMKHDDLVHTETLPEEALAIYEIRSMIRRLH